MRASRTLARLLPATTILALLAACGDDPAASDAACEYIGDDPASKEVDLPPSDPDPVESLTLVTNRGEIGVSLRGEETPCTAGSFTSLAEQGFFDGTSCHRLTTENIFVLQCGDPTGTGSGGPGYRFADELTGDETYAAGTLAMANAGPDTNGSQFFIVYDETVLPPSYTVFGEIDADGLALVEEVAEAGTDTGAGDGAPATEVMIESVESDGF